MPQTLRDSSKGKKSCLDVDKLKRKWWIPVYKINNWFYSHYKFIQIKNDSDECIKNTVISLNWNNNTAVSNFFMIIIQCLAILSRKEIQLMFKGHSIEEAG